MSGEKCLTAVIDDNFLSENLSALAAGDRCCGALKAVVRNNRRLTFILSCGKSAIYYNQRLVYVRYIDGPKQSIRLKAYIYVVNDSAPGRTENNFAPEVKLIRGDRVGRGVPLPRCPRNESLHVMGVLLIPESAFDDPEQRYQVDAAPTLFKPLYDELKTKDIKLLLVCLEVSHTHKLTELAQACAQSLNANIKQQNNVSEEMLLRTIELALENKHQELTETCEAKLVERVQLHDAGLTTNGILNVASHASRYEAQLKNLFGACIQWFGRNWNQITEDGLGTLMEQDNTYRVLPRILGQALSSYSSK